MENAIIEKEFASQFELRCGVAGRPTPTIRWYRNGREFFPKHGDSGIRLEERSQKLIFTRLLDKDSGSYECRATNRGGTVARRALLRVVGVYDGAVANSLQMGEILITLFLVLFGLIMLVLALFIGKRIRDEKVRKRD